jgi:hypothetical protein
VLRDGICFTVAHQSEDFKRTLIYSNNYRTFVSEVDFEEDMDPIRIVPTNRFGEPNKCDVRLFMRFGTDGYNLGIRVPNRWWDQVKASCQKAINEDNDYATGQVELFLATISYREFDLYWEPVEWSSTFYEKTAKRIRIEEMRNARNLHGRRSSTQIYQNFRSTGRSPLSTNTSTLSIALFDF